MTRHVLILVLKNRPPLHVVEFMLSLNPQAADIPPQGPSPLQVAVRHNASVDVIRLVIQACPLALVATHSGYDPLMYAKVRYLIMYIILQKSDSHTIHHFIHFDRFGDEKNRN